MKSKEPRQKFRRLALWIFVGFLGLVVLLVLIDLLSSPGYTPPPLPEPNGYDDLLRAGNMIKVPRRGGNLIFAEDASLEELRKSVNENRKALEIARVGLGRECRMSLEKLIEDTNSGRSGISLMSLYSLCEAFRAEGILAEREGRLSGALRSYCDLVLLAIKGNRGGTLVHHFICMVQQGKGVKALRGIHEKLAPAQCREAVFFLLSARQQREPLDTFMARERYLQRKTGNIVQRIRDRILFLGGEKRSENHSRTAESQYQILLIQLALQAYRSKNHRYPAILLCLVPEFLDPPPRDPWTGKPLIYRPGSEAGKYVLYSAGPNGKDDGGQGDDVKPGE